MLIKADSISRLCPGGKRAGPTGLSWGQAEKLSRLIFIFALSVGAVPIERTCLAREEICLSSRLFWFDSGATVRGAYYLECRSDAQWRGCHWRQGLLADRYGSRLPPKWSFDRGQWLPPGDAPSLQEKDWILVRSLLV